jgi:fructose-1-phosphate kinase PfkB-like protein
MYESREYRIHLVDRVGGGDCFGGGLIYSLMSGYDAQKALEFAVAASCLKQATENRFQPVHRGGGRGSDGRRRFRAHPAVIKPSAPV